MPIKITESKQHITDLLISQGIGTLATCDASGQPHASTIYYTFDDDLNIYFVTKTGTNKSMNLQVNPRAGLAVHEADSQSTVQVTGSVSEVIDDEFKEKIFAEVLRTSSITSEAGVPPILKLEAGQYIVYKITPSSMRLASYIRPDSGDNEQIFEVI